MALIEEVTATPVAPPDGVVLVTVGGVLSGGGVVAAVVNDQLVAGVRKLPAMSFTPVVTVAVYDVEGDNDDAGTNVATKPFNDTAPAIEVPALFFSVNVEVLTVAGCTASLNVALIEEVTATPVAPPDGVVLVTVGGVLSGGGVVAAVVNDQLVAGVRKLPAMSFTPVVTVAVYDVEGDNDDAGTNVATKPFNDTAPAIEVPALFFSVNVEVLTVAGCTASLNVALIEEVTATPVAPPDGVVLVTVGGVASATDFVMVN